MQSKNNGEVNKIHAKTGEKVAEYVGVTENLKAEDLMSFQWQIACGMVGAFSLRV